jgi:hypothetical protein
MKNLSKYIFKLFLFLAIFDFTGDPIIRSYNIELANFEFYYKSLLTSLFLLLLIFNLKFKFNLKKIYIPFILICLIFFYGFLVGIINNVLINVFNELSGYIFILFTPIIVNLYEDSEYNEDLVIYYIKIVTKIIFFKIFIYEIATLIIFGIPSYKILLKQSPLFLIFFSILIDKLLKKQKGIKILFLITCFILFIAFARMIYIAMFFILLIHFIKNINFNKIKIYLQLFIFIILAFIFFIKIQSLDYLGTIDRLYGGDVYEEGVDYRITQFYVILKRFYEYPLGAGFGYFTPNYLTYDELAKPYLLELDLFNFFSKIGFFFSFIYILIISYILFYTKNKLNKNNSLFAFFIGIISLLIYSLGQTAHQGYLYWIAFSIFYSSLILNHKSYLNHNLK